MLNIIFSLALLLAPSNHYRAVKDTCEINEPDYKGYIMPLEAYPGKQYDTGSVFYRPSRAEVVKAEKFLKFYLDSFCQKVGTIDSGLLEKYLDDEDYDKYDCFVIKNHFKHYYRQYAASIHTKTNHKHLYINCISPEMQKSSNFSKRKWDGRDCDGGTIYFQAEIDLNTGNVSFRDNGWG